MENGSPVCTHRNHKYDSSCMTQCDRGYGLSSGIIFSTCQEDKTWSTDLPDCEGNLSLVLPRCLFLLLYSIFTFYVFVAIHLCLSEIYIAFCEFFFINESSRIHFFHREAISAAFCNFSEH